jgi:hypothetical protein
MLDFEELLLLSAQIGIRPSEFWEMTYAEFSICVDAYSNNQKIQMQGMIIQAYLTASLSRTKKLPNLEDLLEDTEENSDEKLYKKVQELQQKMGGVKNG